MSRLWCRYKGVGANPTPTPLKEPEKRAEVHQKIELAEEVVEPKAEPKVWTRTEINRLRAEEVIELAKSEGLDSTLSGNKTKKLLIEHFGL